METNAFWTIAGVLAGLTGVICTLWGTLYGVIWKDTDIETIRKRVIDQITADHSNATCFEVISAVYDKDFRLFIPKITNNWLKRSGFSNVVASGLLLLASIAKTSGLFWDEGLVDIILVTTLGGIHIASLTLTAIMLYLENDYYIAFQRYEKDCA